MKLPKSFYSWTTAIGAAIAAISIVLFVFLLILSFLFGESSGYTGLVTFIILPVLIVLGLLMIPIGIFRKSRKYKKAKIIKEVKFPIVNFNDPKQRRIFFVFGAGTVIFLMLIGLGSYEGFHYTETTEFCGTLCHEVMKPEYTAYQHSPHAKVSCVECHIGSGASWTVKSKLSGLYQVYSVAFNKFPTPIPTPIDNLRPARETCEECHWPEKFYSPHMLVEKHYLPDEENTEWDIHLKMKIGPENSAFGLSEGIHWHINKDVQVEYAATGSHRENIPWVRYTNKETGEVVVYKDEDYSLTAQQFDSLEIRTMDCLDCHTRPSHEYLSPVNFVNDAITSRQVPKELPDIKMLAMEIFILDFPTTDSAMKYIEATVNEYYEIMYEEIFSEDLDMINQAILGLQEQYKLHIFPEMKVKWDAYPNQIGHLEFNGCFRCHNNKQQDGNGRFISMDCDLCHTILAQGVPDTLQMTTINNSLEFVHPNDPKQAWKNKLCVECHKDLYE